MLQEQQGNVVLAVADGLVQHRHAVFIGSTDGHGCEAVCTLNLLTSVTLTQRIAFEAVDHIFFRGAAFFTASSHFAILPIQLHAVL